MGTSQKALLLYLAFLLFVVTTHGVKNSKKSSEPDTVKSVVPEISGVDVPKLSSKFVTITGQTSRSCFLVADRRLYYVEASTWMQSQAAATKISKSPFTSLFKKRTSPQSDDRLPTRVEQTVDYQLQPANEAATSLACSKLHWVEFPISYCWELSSNLVVGYVAQEMSVYWVTLGGKRRTSAFTGLEAQQLQGAKSIDVMAASDSLKAFIVSFVISYDKSSELGVYSFKVDLETAENSLLQDTAPARTLLVKGRKMVDPHRGEVVVVCKLIYGPLSASVQGTGRFRALMQIFKQNGEPVENKSYQIDDFTEWTGVPTIDLFVEQTANNNNNNNPVIQLYYYRPQTGIIREMQLAFSATGKHCSVHDYPLNMFGESLDGRQTKHWTWKHTPTNGHPATTHAFLNQYNNELYLISQNVMSPARFHGHHLVGAKYSVFTLVSGLWQLQRQSSLPSDYAFSERSDICK